MAIPLAVGTAIIPYLRRSLSVWPTPFSTLRAFEKKGSGTVAGTAQRVLRTTVPDPFFSDLRSFFGYNRTMKKTIPLAFLAYIVFLGVLLQPIPASPSVVGGASCDYVVVVSRTTFNDAGWRRVVDTLVAKHKAKVVQYDKSVNESLTALKEIFPRYACFVAKPTEATTRYVADISILTRQLDDDPYTDVIWGIVTGFDADNALRIVSDKQPLIVKRVAAGTDIALEKCSEGIWYSELQAGHQVVKNPGSQPIAGKGPTDSTQLLAAEIVDKNADLFITSGHASEKNWQIGFRYKNGFFKSKNGEMFGLDVDNKTFTIKSDHPRVYMAVGNCLMGHIDGPDAMALAWMNSAGVRQMIGYTVLTWYGYAGWGCLDYFVEQPGRYTLAEAFIANQHALMHRLATYHPEGMTLKNEPGSRPTGIALGARPKPPN